MHFCTALAYLGLSQDCNGQPPLSAQERSFVDHLSEQGISYGTKEEYEFRFTVYQKADEQINMVNSNPKYTFEAGHN